MFEGQEFMLYNYVNFINIFYDRVTNTLLF